MIWQIYNHKEHSCWFVIWCIIIITSNSLENNIFNMNHSFVHNLHLGLYYTSYNYIRIGHGFQNLIINNQNVLLSLGKRGSSMLDLSTKTWTTLIWLFFEIIAFFCCSSFSSSRSLALPHNTTYSPITIAAAPITLKFKTRSWCYYEKRKL